MLQTDLINEFLSKKIIAVIGVSREGQLPANYIYKKFRENDYKVFQINPNADEIENDICYHSISELPEKPDAVFLASTPEVSEKAMLECSEQKIPIVWMHRGIGKGSYSKKAEQIGQELGIKVINNGCPMMFVGKVDWFHRIARWFKK